MSDYLQSQSDRTPYLATTRAAHRQRWQHVGGIEGFKYAIAAQAEFSVMDQSINHSQQDPSFVIPTLKGQGQVKIFSFWIIDDNKWQRNDVFKRDGTVLHDWQRHNHPGCYSSFSMKYLHRISQPIGAIRFPLHYQSLTPNYPSHLPFY